MKNKNSILSLKSRLNRVQGSLGVFLHNLFFYLDLRCNMLFAKQTRVLRGIRLVRKGVDPCKLYISISACAANADGTSCQKT